MQIDVAVTLRAPDPLAYAVVNTNGIWASEELITRSSRFKPLAGKLDFISGASIFYGSHGGIKWVRF